MDLQGSIVSLDGVYDCRANRKAIFNRGMVPNINPNPRGRKQPKRGRKPIFEPAIFEERFHTIERVFAWEDKFRRLLLRFERISRAALRVQDARLHDDQSPALLPGLIGGRYVDASRDDPYVRTTTKTALVRYDHPFVVCGHLSPYQFSHWPDTANVGQNPQPVDHEVPPDPS